MAGHENLAKKAYEDVGPILRHRDTRATFLKNNKDLTDVASKSSKVKVKHGSQMNP